MMKNYFYKSISLLLVVTMSGWCLAGCGTSSNNNEKAVEEETTSDITNMEALLTSKVGSSDDTEKKETVYVEMKADGTVTKTTVSDVLKVSGEENISDYSTLENIINISGEEQFARNDDGTLIWENKGENISYQGTTTEEPPINIKVTYYLDDKEISAEELAGKSGKVKIVYDYTNNAKNDNGDFVPFLVLTGMVMDSDNFSNVEVDNGKVIDHDGSSIVIGYAVPGLKDELLSSINKADDYLGDINLPESVTVSADAKEFSLDMTLTAAASQIGDMDLKETLDFSDIEEQMDELQDGADQLADGSQELDDGAGKLVSGSSQINSGAKDLSQYTLQMAEGTKKLDNKYTIFNKALLEGVKSADSGAKQIYDGAKKVKSGAKDLEDGSKQLASGISQVKSSFEDQKNSDGTVKSQGLVNGSKSLKEGISSANEGVQTLVEGMQSTPDAIQKSIDAVIEKLSPYGIQSEKALYATVESINNAIEENADVPLATVLQGAGLNTQTYYSLLNAYYSVQTLEQVKTQLSAQVSASAGDIKTLLAGMNALEDGSTALDSGINQLYSGVKELDSGAKELTSGTAELKSGASELTTAMKQLYSGLKTLDTKVGDASPQIKTGISEINAAAKAIGKGAGTLSEGAAALDDGIITLADGTKELKDGAIKLNDEGISKITGIFANDAPEAVETMENILNSGKDYRSFSGISDDMSGEVKFIFKTEEIKADNK